VVLVADAPAALVVALVCIVLFLGRRQSAPDGDKD
jgi:hypothetical protein